MQNYFAKITSIYTRWTENRYSTSVHFAVFGLFALLAFTTVFNSVSELLVQSESSQVAIVSQAVQKMKIPPPERSTAGPRSGTEIIVGFESSAGESKRNEIAQTMLLTKRGEIPALGAQIFTVSEDDTPQEVIDRLTHEHKKNVRFAEVNSILAPEYVPNDPLWSTQWHIPKVGVDTAWDTTKGAEVTVAVLDTGVDCTHPDLAQNCLSGFNIPSNNTESSDLYGHGTKVAGVIVAVADNALGVAGASPLTRVLPVRVTNDAQGLASYSDIASGIVYAADKGAKVVNVSYAAYGSAAVTSAAEYLKGKGGVLTMSSGNAGTISTVKNDPNIIVVGATDMGDVRASWSSYGTPIDVVAPGLAISTTAVGGGFISMSGTSFSAPLTAAVASLVWSKVPSLSNAQLSNVLLGTALDKGVSGYDEQ
jgi:subtilisin family serine protease